MGLFDKIGKKKPEEEKQEEIVAAKTPEELKKERASSFVMGVEYIMQKEDAKEIVVIGKLDGRAVVGNTVTVSNPGRLSNEKSEVQITAIRTTDGDVREVSGGSAELHLSMQEERNFRIGDVLYTADVPAESTMHAYAKALTETYVIKRQLELSDQELEQLSVSDLQEMLRFHAFLQDRFQSEQGPESAIPPERVKRLEKSLANRILEEDYIYCVFSKKTGEPYLYSRTTSDTNGGYHCSAPTIRIFTEEYKSRMQGIYEGGRFEVKRIENGSKGKGIYNFFGIAFYLDGAEGVEVISDDTILEASLLVEKPDERTITENGIPVSNPDLMKWLLMLGQMDKADLETDDGKIIYTLYYKFMAAQATKAKFLVPIHAQGKMPEANEEGVLQVEDGTRFDIPCVPGKNGRKAIFIFTDWRHLYGTINEKCEAVVETIDSLINSFDCIINSGDYSKGGGYISLSTYNEMDEIASSMGH